jgi:hypothetical protein
MESLIFIDSNIGAITLTVPPRSMISFQRD